MPVPSLGPCVWRAATNPQDPVEPVPAIITQVGQRSVMLTVFAPDNRGGLPKDGVRHIGDPELGDHPNYEGGCWDFTDDHKRIAGLEQMLASNTSNLSQVIAGHREELDQLRKDLDELKKSLLG